MSFASGLYCRDEELREIYSADANPADNNNLLVLCTASFELVDSLLFVEVRGTLTNKGWLDEEMYFDKVITSQQLDYQCSLLQQYNNS